MNLARIDPTRAQVTEVALHGGGERVFELQRSISTQRGALGRPRHGLCQPCGLVILGLKTFGRGRLFHKTTELDEQELEEVIGAVTSAAVVMSQRKVGALIVFERETGLEERIETGVQIDGLVSDSLLLNIFEKDTPLHDGAVIIRGKRIVAASCLLPLTDARNLSQELGTRHRSALGISEQSDAIVLVVSEETGTISLAKNGELLRYLQADDVKELLRAGIMTQLKPKAGLLEQLRRRFQGGRQ